MFSAQAANVVLEAPPPTPGELGDGEAGKDIGWRPCLFRGVRAFGSTPLEKAHLAYFERMPSAVRQKHLQLVEHALAAIDRKVISVGSACSGSDISFVVFEVLLHYLNETFETKHTLGHTFICERDDQKRQFLETQFRPEMSFQDVASIAQSAAWDCMSASERFVPWVYLFTAGFSCKSRSSLNKKRASHTNCLQRQDPEAETSSTFEAIYQYIARVRPECLILENVAGLLEKVSAEAQSDADYVISRLAAAGYAAMYTKFDCEDFGSRASRTRLYFLAWQIALDGSEVDTGSSAYAEVLRRLQWLESFLEHLAIGPMASSAFLTFDVAEATKHFERFDVGYGPWVVGVDGGGGNES